MLAAAQLSRRALVRILVVLAAAIAVVLSLVGTGRTAPLPDTPTYPKVAFVARNDVPFDSMAVGPIAGAAGGIVVITSPTALSQAARDALVAFAPDLVVIAGGSAAISEAVAAQVDAAGPWSVVRKSGAGRDQTAAALATVLTDLAMGRPALTGGGQVVGDAHLGGRVTADTLRVVTSAALEGPLTVPSIAWSAPVEHVATIGQIAFGPGSSGTPYTQFNGGVQGSGSNGMYAPVSLPVGAVVTGMTAHILDEDAANNLTVRLSRTPVGTSEFEAMAEVTSSGSSAAHQQATAAGVTDGTIDSGYAYQLIAFSNTTWGSTRLQAVQITYTVPGPS